MAHRKPITKCPHTDAPKTVGGMCQKCYSKAYHRKRYDTDPAFVASLRKRAQEWRVTNLERARNADYLRHTQRNFGMSHGEYTDRVAAQGNACAICRQAAAVTTKPRLHVDHNHTTGKTRGLLCHWCNAGLGQFRDDAARLRAAADYLDHWQHQGDTDGR